MRYSAIVIGLAVAFATAASAADKPVIAPAPAWVKPVAIPAVPAKPGETAVSLLLSDQQVKFEKGSETVYTDYAMLIQTPQGLAAGNLSLPWRPDTDTLTVHKLLIHRGDKIIDVLGAGQTFTVLRREQNLESAMLDGVLTANIQPEGLQVGDVLELAMSVTSSDPVMKGHVEQIAGTWNGAPINRAHLYVEWPNSLPLHFRQIGALPALKPVRKGDSSTVELSLDNLQPLPGPNGAPTRYQIGRMIEMTDYANWSDIAALMAPLYAKAATIPASGALHDELEKIRGASSDPKARAEAALALVQDRTRYVALTMGAGGYVPADAAETWARRYGDCKGKTALLLALLHALDIEAEPVMVNSQLGDGMDQRLPMVRMVDHVLVRAVVAGKTYWLDGTRSGDTGLDRLRTPDFGWGLPLAASNAALVRILPAPLDQPDSTTTIRIDAHGGITAPAPFTVETVLRGDSALLAKIGLGNLAGDARDRALREYWRRQYDFVEIKSASAIFDAKTGEERVTMEGTATLDWSSGWYQTDGTGIGFRADFTRDVGQDKDAPFAVAYPSYNRVSETILLPPGFAESDISHRDDVDQTVAGMEYHRRTKLAANVVTIEASERSIAPEFPARDAPAAQATLRRLADQNVSLRKPSGYVGTETEVKGALATTPTTASGFVDRGNVLLTAKRYDEAIKDFDSALALDPKNVWALADRGISHVWKQEFDAAEKDFAAAQAIDPKNIVIYRGRGLMAQQRNNPQESVVQLTKALEIDPNDSFSLFTRASSNGMIGNRDAMIKDYDTVLASDPGNIAALAARGGARAGNREFAAAAKDADAIAAIDPDNVAIARLRGVIAQGEQKPKEALAQYSKALEADPDNAIGLFQRATANFNLGNYDLALADASAAIKHDPKLSFAYTMRAFIYLGRGQREQAIAEAKAGIAADPDNADAHLAAGGIYQNSGDPAGAVEEYSKAIAIRPNAMAYASRAAARPVTDRAARRADIDAALKLDPDSMLVLQAKASLQQEEGDTKGAIETLSAAIAGPVVSAHALMQRAELYRRTGQLDLALADTAQALKLEPRNDDIYLLRANLFTLQGKSDDAMREAAAVEAADPDNSYAHVIAANVYSKFHKDADALRAYDRAIAIKPEPYIYLNRGQHRPKTDLAAREADFDAALKLDPKFFPAIAAKADLQNDRGDHAGAVATLSAALQQSPGSSNLLARRGTAYARAGNAAKANEDFQQARAKVQTATEFNNLCWEKATAGVALDTALADCNDALAKAPDTPGFLDSRALVLLRLGRIDDAIADYDRALAKSPNLPSSLFGRAVAWSRKGDKVKSATDAAAAIKIDPDVKSDFEGYGVTL